MKVQLYPAERQVGFIICLQLLQSETKEKDLAEIMNGRITCFTPLKYIGKINTILIGSVLGTI